MSKKILLVVIFFIQLVILPTSASADNVNGININVSSMKVDGIETKIVIGRSSSDPKRDANIEITVTADQTFFHPEYHPGNIGGPYYTYEYRASPPKGQQCTQSQSHTNPFGPYYNPTDDKNLTVKFQIPSDCLANKDNWGQWKVVFWNANNAPQPKTENIFISNFNFVIVPPNKALPIMTPENPTLNWSDKPRIHISNLSKGLWYRLWWEGERTPALSGGGNNDTLWQAQSDDDVIKELNSPISDPMQIPKYPKKLNLAFGGDHLIFDVNAVASTLFTFTGTSSPPLTQGCTFIPSDKPSITDNISIKATNLPQDSYYATLIRDSDQKPYPNINPILAGSILYFQLPKLEIGDYTITIFNSSTKQSACPLPKLSVQPFEITQFPSPTPCTGANCTKGGGETCNKGGAARGPGINTAIGCIHTNPAEFAKDMLTFAIGIGGGLAFLMMLLGAFQMLTSAGNPETLQAGRDRLTSAIIGLLFIIFAVLLLQIIGADILGLKDYFKK